MCPRKGRESMLKKVVISALLFGVAVVVVNSIPDIRRYLRIRNM